MSTLEAVVSQFKYPHGPLGHLAGWVMAARSSNRERNDWTIDLLRIEPDHRVLEFGFGPGYAVERIAGKLESGRITGIDHSEVMLRQARRRNADAIALGKVKLLCWPVTDLKRLQVPFDRVFSANVAQFWDDRVAVFREILRLIAPRGRGATTYQPRHPHGRGCGSFRRVGNCRNENGGVPGGAAGIRTKTPVLAVCVTGEF
jgi:SAM-dependent methyltransferase